VPQPARGGKGTLDVKGEAVPILNPRVIDLSTVQDQVRAAKVRRWTRFGIRHCLRIERAAWSPCGL